MRRLPNTYPGNTTLYPNGRGTIGIGAADAGSKVLFYNETPVNLDLDFYNGDTDVLHAWEANFWYLDGEVSDITWAIDTDSLNVVNPPINAVFTTVYGPTERINEKAYPMPLIRQIGGQQAIVSSASQTINDGNALQQVVEATLQGHGSSDVIINNDGSYTIKGAGLLAAVGILTHILGNLTVDGTLTQTGAASFNAAGSSLTTTNDAAIGGSLKTNTIRDSTNGNAAIDLSLGTGDIKLVTGRLGRAASADIIDANANDTYIKSRSTGIIHFQVPNGTGVLDIASNGPTLLSGTAYHFLTGSISRQNGNGNIACGSGTTITHGLGATPAIVLATPNIAQAGSATVGIGNVGSTTFQCTVGSGTAVSFWTLTG